jgi:SAM-dependent methyltransferase
LGGKLAAESERGLAVGNRNALGKWKIGKSTLPLMIHVMSYPPRDAYQERLDRYYEYGKAKIAGCLRVFHRQRLDTILDLIGRPKGKDVAASIILDAGCGCGANVIRYAKLGARVIGIDIAERVLDRSREWMDEEMISDRAALMRADVLAPPFRDGSFDIVLSSDVLSVAGETRKGVEQTARLVKEGGTAIIAVPNALSIFWVGIAILERLSNLAGMAKTPSEEFKRYFFWDVKSIIESAGLRPNRVRSVYIIPLLHFGWYDKLEQKIRSRFPFKYLGSHIIIEALK